MKDRDQDKKVLAALLATNRLAEPGEPDAQWNRRVMAEVLAEGRLQEKADSSSYGMQSLAFRFSAVACTLALVLSLYAFDAGIGAEQLAMSLFLDGPLSTLSMGLFAL